MFYTYRQNNSGGGFDFDTSAGISVEVRIEADSAEEANDRAERIGLYFDGAGDCECCGPRWSPAWVFNDEGAAEDVPIYGTWAPKGVPELYVHYANGEIRGYVPQDGEWVLVEGGE